jgi:crotonobetainyl-CoA:carnitine CoA-transferase CaiB-like acyl-CoA transferase
MTGMYAAVAVLAALASRNVTGEGQYIDLALLDAQVAVLANVAMNYLVSGTVPKRYGTAHANLVPYQVFASRDGYIVLAVGNDRQFAAFCNVAGRSDLAADARFASNDGRVRNRAALIPIIAALMAQRASEDWLGALDAAGVPSGPINDIAQVFADPQVRHRGMRIELPHSLAGGVPQVANPIKLSKTPLEYPSAPPLLGQHTREILRARLGMSDEEIESLSQRGVI